MLLEFIGSVAFVGGYIAGCKYVWCKLRTWNFDNSNIKFILGISLSCAGLFSGIFLFFEKLSRRAEITLFLAPKYLETLWHMLEKRNLVTKIDYWEFLIFGIAMGIINYYYINHVYYNLYY